MSRRVRARDPPPSSPVRRNRAGYPCFKGVAMAACPTCGAEYSSPLAAELCGDDDREQDLHARQVLRGRGKK